LKSNTPHINIYHYNKSTMATTLVALIIGAGPRVGASVAATFASNGYKVAIASRKGTGSNTAEGYLSLKVDCTQPESIPALFDAVKSEFAAAPSVVVYNAATLTPPPDKDSALSVPAETVGKDINVNTISPYVAAQLAVSGWETLPEQTKKTFIYTGNILNVALMPVPMMLTLGMGKSASSFWIGLADSTYSARGFR
jgi:NAD(P)-dependent dehydrogenase (short-subunit alcohol dehydrogenase family)